VDFACGKLLAWSAAFAAPTLTTFSRSYSFTAPAAWRSLFWLIYWLARSGEQRPCYSGDAAEAAWELFENTNFIIERYRSTTAALGYNGDTVVTLRRHSLCIAGFLIAQRLACALGDSVSSF